MFWSVWAGARGGRGRIETAAMDGSGRRTLLADELHWPSGLALSAAGELYWCDTFRNTLERLELRTGVRTLLLAGAAKPYGLVLHEGALIWSEHGSGAVRRRDPDGNITDLYRLPPPLYDLKLVSDTQRQGMLCYILLSCLYRSYLK